MPFGGALTVGLISAGTSIFGGIFGSKAAKTAAQLQAESAIKAGQGVQTAVDEVNPQIQSAANTATEGITNAAGTASANVVNTASDAARDARYAGADAGTGVTAASVEANKLLDPWSKVGGEAATTLGGMLAPGGQLTKQFDASMMESQDPGYQFRIAQGNKAIERSAAARGITGNGGVLKALSNYGQQSASAEYGAAFDRFTKQNDSTFSRLSDLSKTGMVASGQQAGNITGAAKQTGDYLTNASQFSGNTLTRGSEVAGGYGTRAAEVTGGYATQAARDIGANTLMAAEYRGNAGMQAGNAQAAGKVGSANAWTGMLSGIAGAASGVVQSKQLNSALDNGMTLPPRRY